jgi:hypothetical protein
LCNIYLVKTGTTDIIITFIQNLKRHPTTWAPLAATAIRLREARNPMLCNNPAQKFLLKNYTRNKFLKQLMARIKYELPIELIHNLSDVEMFQLACD